MSDAAYAYRSVWKGSVPFGGEEKEHVAEGIVHASTAEHAVRAVVRKSSVLAIKCGLDVEVARVSWAKATRRRATYSDVPMLDHALVNPKAKLVISRGR